MGDFVFNNAKGKFAEWSEVAASAAGAAVLNMHAWNSTASDATLKDLLTIANIEADANTAEVATGGWGRKSIDSTNIVITENNTNDRVEVDVPDQTWTAVTAGAVTDLGVSYDSTGAEADSVERMGTWHDFIITPDGSDVTAQIAAGPPAGVYSAT